MARISKQNQGKHVDTWQWERKDGQKIPVKLFLKKSQDEGLTIEGQRRKPPYPTTATIFFVEMENPEFYYEGTDCEALRAAVWAKLDKRYAIKWEKYFVVQIRPSRPYRGTGEGLTLEYYEVEKGTTFDGKFLIRDRDWNSRSYEWIIRPWEGEYSDKNGVALACIPATKENERGLKEFQLRIAELRRLLEDFVKPEVFQQNLMALATSHLLPDLRPNRNEERKARAITSTVVSAAPTDLDEES